MLRAFLKTPSGVGNLFVGVGVIGGFAMALNQSYKRTKAHVKEFEAGLDVLEKKLDVLEREANIYAGKINAFYTEVSEHVMKSANSTA